MGEVHVQELQQGMHRGNSANGVASLVETDAGATDLSTPKGVGVSTVADARDTVVH